MSISICCWFVYVTSVHLFVCLYLHCVSMWCVCVWESIYTDNKQIFESCPWILVVVFAVTNRILLVYMWSFRTNQAHVFVILPLFHHSPSNVYIHTHITQYTYMFVSVFVRAHGLAPHTFASLLNTESERWFKNLTCLS